MKKSIIISAIALCFSVGSVQATPEISGSTLKLEAFYQVNSFCVSIAKGDIETVRKLITRGADVNEMSNGMTPAMYAAKFNRTEILELLIAHGANLKVKSDKMMTALKYARLHGAKNTESLILQAIADAKAKKRK